MRRATLRQRVLMAAAAVALIGTMPATITAQDRVFPNVRQPTVNEPDVRQAPRGREERTLPSGTPLRDSSGRLRGFVDTSPEASRGIARRSDGRAVGSVTSNRLGGGIVRRSDGSLVGIVPSRPTLQRFEPRRRSLSR